MKASFQHLVDLFTLEEQNAVKQAFKLSEKVLNPNSLERQSVKLAEAVFHDITIASLQHHEQNGQLDFGGIVHFLSLVSKLWKMVKTEAWQRGSEIMQEKWFQWNI